MGRLRGDDEEPINLPQSPEDVNAFAVVMMVEFIAASEHREFM